MITREAREEHAAWRQMCLQLERLGIDPDGPDGTAVLLAAKLWGERLHGLRLTAPEHDASALRVAKDRYLANYYIEES